MNLPRLAALLAAALLGLAAAAAAQGQPPEVKDLRGGGVETVFRNGCVVVFDSGGRRRSANDKCGPAQIERAEAAAAERLDAAAAAAAAPEVIPQRNGEFDVAFRNGCAFFYRADGERSGDNGRCARDQRGPADEAAERYRREQGLAGNRPGSGPGPRPEIVPQRDGEFDVVFPSGCAAFYGADGRRRETNGRCARDEIERADAAAERHAEAQAPQPPLGGPLPEVTILRDGAPNVVYRNGCEVKFAPSGSLIGGSKACSKDQIERARLAAYEARRN